MSVSRYRLSTTGWIGAAMFVLPTPIASFEYLRVLRRFEMRGDFDRRLERMQNVVALPEFSPWLFTALGTASLIGLVLLLIGREVVTTDR